MVSFHTIINPHPSNRQGKIWTWSENDAYWNQGHIGQRSRSLESNLKYSCLQNSSPKVQGNKPWGEDMTLIQGQEYRSRSQVEVKGQGRNKQLWEDMLCFTLLCVCNLPLSILGAFNGTIKGLYACKMLSKCWKKLLISDGELFDIQILLKTNTQYVRKLSKYEYISTNLHYFPDIDFHYFPDIDFQFAIWCYMYFQWAASLKIDLIFSVCEFFVEIFETQGNTSIYCAEHLARGE